MLHGGFASLNSWGFKAPRLAANHEVVVVDLWGHDRGTLPVAPVSYRQMKGHVIGVLDRLRITRKLVVGLSDGGIVYLLVAIHHPARFDRLFV